MDLDGDGYQDVLSGSWPGQIYWFRRQPDGTFAAAEKLNDRDGNPIHVGSASAVFAADWDNDGDLDLIVGNISGEVYLVANEGSAEQRAFGRPQKLQVDGQPIRVSDGDAGPCLADWDADGKTDLLVSAGDGSVLWYRNIGTVEEPVLAAAQTLVPPTSQEWGSAAGEDPICGRRAKICVNDWNEDGRLDLLLGDLSITQPAASEPSEQDQAAEQEALDQLTGLLDEYRQLRKVPPDESPEAKADRNRKRQELLKQITEVRQKVLDLQARIRPARNYQYHGYVWVFLRKTPTEAVSAR